MELGVGECWVLMYRSGVYVKCVMYSVDMVVYGGRDELWGGRGFSNRIPWFQLVLDVVLLGCVLVLSSVCRM